MKNDRPIWEGMLEDKNACFGAFLILVGVILAAAIFG